MASVNDDLGDRTKEVLPPFLFLLPTLTIDGWKKGISRPSDARRREVNMRFSIEKVELELPSVTVEIHGLPNVQFLTLFCEEARECEKILRETLRDPFQRSLLTKGEHPLQILEELFAINTFGVKDYRQKRKTYEFIKDHLLFIVGNEIYKEVVPFSRTYHHWNKTLTEFPYNVDERIALPLYYLREVCGVKTYSSCQGIQTFVTVKGVKIFVPDGHSPTAYLLTERHDLLEKELIPYLRERVNVSSVVDWWNGEERILIRTMSPHENLNFVKVLCDFVRRRVNSIETERGKLRLEGIQIR